MDILVGIVGSIVLISLIVALNIAVKDEPDIEDVEDRW